MLYLTLLADPHCGYSCQGLVSRIRLWDSFRVLYDNSVSCVRTGGTHSSWFKIEAGVRQGCVLAPDSFATCTDWLLDRTAESCSIGVAFGQSSFTDLDFADDVSLLAEPLELLVPILETITSEAASLGFEVNWQKTKVQALGCREDMPLTIKFTRLIWKYPISNFPPSAAELFRLPPHRSGTHYQTQSFRHQHCGRSSTNWKLFYFKDPLSTSTVIVVSQ